MASDKQAALLANLTRERFMLKSVSRITDLPDYDDLHGEARGLGSREVSAEITRLEREIEALRSRYPITRWVDADPLWRDATQNRVNKH